MKTIPAQSIDDQIAVRVCALALTLLREKHGEDLAAWPDEAREQYRTLTRQRSEIEATDRGEQP